jgi:hypothetical protein
MPNYFGATGHLASQKGGFEPQRQNNFTINISGLGEGAADLLSLSLVSVPLPTMSTDVIELPYGNEKVKVAGTANFEDLNLVVRDFIDENTRKVLIGWFHSMYDPKTGKMGRAKDYKKSGSITMMTPDGKDRPACELQGVFISSFNPGTLDMASAEPVQIELTLSIDKADWSAYLTAA